MGQRRQFTPEFTRQAVPVAELFRLRRKLARVTEERDILKIAAVGSSDQRTIIWGTNERPFSCIL